MMPPTRHGPCSDSVRDGSTPDTAAKTSCLLSAGELEKQVENSEGRPGQARARAIGRGGAEEIEGIPSGEIGVQN